MGAAVKTVPPASPGPPEAATATSLTFPAAVPQCGAVVGYTPSGVAQNAVWAPGSGLFAYAGVCVGRPWGKRVNAVDVVGVRLGCWRLWQEHTRRRIGPPAPEASSHFAADT